MKKNRLEIIIILMAAVTMLTPAYIASETITIQSSIHEQSVSPILQYTPTSHDFGYVEEGTLYYTTFEIWNDGNGTLTWNLTTSDSWIMFLPTNGSSTGEHDTIMVQVNTSGLTPGIHAGSIIINSNDPSGMSVFSISLRVNQPPYTPSRPNGPSEGAIGELLEYTTSTTDPEGDFIRYGLDVNDDFIVDHWSTYYYPSGVTYVLYIRFNSSGTYHLRFKAKDNHGAQSDFSASKEVVITGGNNAPDIPSTPTGPSSGSIDTSYSFTTNSTDPEGDDIRYGWDWNGDNVIDQWTGFYPSGETVTLSHLYTIPGTYQIKVIAEDEHGAQSAFSPTKTIVITGNVAPNKPETPTGKIKGSIGLSYSYISSTTDANGDKIYYQFDWGDDSTTDWIGPYESGSEITASHIWSSKGSFTVKVKAKDDPNGDGNLDDGKESVWSDPLAIQMPKTKTMDHPFFQILEHFPNLYRFVQQLLTY